MGSRLGLSTPKQFFKVAGKMVVEHTVDAFECNPHIDEIAIVSNPFYVSDFESIVIKNGWKKVKRILKGGKERYESSLSAIKAYEGDDVNLIFHDAVRPLVSQRILDDVVKALNSYDAIDVAMPATDTIIEMEGDFIHQIPDRSRLQRGQTPQAFRLEIIDRAYEVALKDPLFKVTDDCGVVVKYLPHVPVYVVRGEESNMKLTYKEDTYLLDKFFQLRKSELHDEQPDERLLKEKVAVVFGGSYGIGREVARLLGQKQARVFCFSRSMNGVDIGNREEVADALAKVFEQTHRIDYVINSAGMLRKEPLIGSDYATICDAINTNYTGTINVALEAYSYLKESKGALLFFTSSSYTRGRAFYSIYSSTKAAIVNFVQAIAQEWEPFGIRVNCVNPERTKTPMRVKNFGIEPDDSLLMPEQVAEATVQTLLSDFTGQVIDVKRKNL
jgi:2-C-methyl-D-erythritol 4-phosphate cytidylyltransferase